MKGNGDDPQDLPDDNGATILNLTGGPDVVLAPLSENYFIEPQSELCSNTVSV